MSTITPVFPSLAPASRVGSRPSGRSSSPAGAASSVRLTRRGRVVFFLLGLALVAVAAMTLAAGSAASDEQGAAGQVEVVTVVPGETLWSIASDVAAATGESDVRDVMHHIQQLNTLDSSVVYAGQELRVPGE